jgi:hypothetical protein
MATGRALLIAPVPSRGLQPADLDDIDAFLTADHEADASGAAHDEAIRIARHLLGGPSPT